MAVSVSLSPGLSVSPTKSNCSDEFNISASSYDMRDYYDMEPDYENNCYREVQIACPYTHDKHSLCMCKFCEKHKKQEEQYIANEKNKQYDELMKEYNEYCNLKNYPNFLGYRGYCFNCTKNNLDHWLGTGKTDLISGCHYCGRTYCD